MEKEKASIHQLSVCYCLLKRENHSRAGTTKTALMTEALNRIQAFYENKGAVGMYSQAFVYGNGNAFARPFEAYPFGFRAGLDEKIEKYDLTETVVLCYALLDDYLPENEENQRAIPMKDMYRLVIISDYPLNMEGEATDQIIQKINALKARCDFKVVYEDITGNPQPGSFEKIIDFYGCEEDEEM